MQSEPTIGGVLTLSSVPLVTHSDVCSTPMGANGAAFVAVLTIIVLPTKFAVKLDHLQGKLGPLHKINHLPAITVTTTLSPAATISLSTCLLLFRSRTLPLCFPLFEQLLFAQRKYVNS